MRNHVAVLAAAALIAGCGGSSSSGGGGGATTVRCLVSIADVCAEVTAVMTAADLTTVSTECAATGGTYAASACSATSRVPGYCSLNAAANGIPFTGATLKFYYYTPSWDATTAQADCVDPLGTDGTWVP